MDAITNYIRTVKLISYHLRKVIASIFLMIKIESAISVPLFYLISNL